MGSRELSGCGRVVVVMESGLGFGAEGGECNHADHMSSAVLR